MRVPSLDASGTPGAEPGRFPSRSTASGGTREDLALDRPRGRRARDQLESPGRYFHPLLATLITSAARLMLGIAERLTLDAGLDWAFCDTDSLAIAKPTAMSEAEFTDRADDVEGWFDALNPYPDHGTDLRDRGRQLGPRTGRPPGRRCRPAVLLRGVGEAVRPLQPRCGGATRRSQAVGARPRPPSPSGWRRACAGLHSGSGDEAR